MKLELTDAETQEIRNLIEHVLGELSMEIADTDNPEFRRALDSRRSHLRDVYEKLIG